MDTPPRRPCALLGALPLPPTPDSVQTLFDRIPRFEDVALLLAKRMREGTPPSPPVDEQCDWRTGRRDDPLVEDCAVVRAEGRRPLVVVFSPPPEQSFAALDLSSRWPLVNKSALARITFRDVKVQVDELGASDLPCLSTMVFYNCQVAVAAGCAPLRTVERLVVSGSSISEGSVFLTPRLWPSLRHLAVLNRTVYDGHSDPHGTEQIELDVATKHGGALVHQLATLAAVPLRGNTSSVTAMRNLRGLATRVERVDNALLQVASGDNSGFDPQPSDFPSLQSLRLLPPPDEEAETDRGGRPWMDAHRRVVHLIHEEELVERRRCRRRWQSSRFRDDDSVSDRDSDDPDSWRTRVVHFPNLMKLVLAASNRLAQSKRWSSGIGVEVKGWDSALAVLSSVETGRRPPL